MGNNLKKLGVPLCSIRKFNSLKAHCKKSLTRLKIWLLNWILQEVTYSPEVELQFKLSFAACLK